MEFTQTLIPAGLAPFYYHPPETAVQIPTIDDQFARLYEAHLEAVYSYCFFRVRDRQMAEDLTASYRRLALSF